jgi:iron complex outermembrane receptor protein
MRHNSSQKAPLSIAIMLAAGSASFGTPSVAIAASLEEIIVTSRRTEESVQQVPVAVSAISAEMLENRGIARMNDLVQQTPAVMSVGVAGRLSDVNFGIRGLRSTDVLPTTDPAVIVYIADVPQMRGQGLGSLGSLDIQTVEVLKGPQGTLFGRSTTGGAIVITPNAPTQDLTASVSVGVGEYNRQMARAIGNAPITDTVAARVAVQKEKADGYIDNKGPVGRDDYADRDELIWRGSLQFTPTDALTSTFYTDGFQADDSGAAVQVTNINTAPQDGIVAGASLASPFAGAAYRSMFDRFNADAAAADGRPYRTTTDVPNGHSKQTVYGVSNTTTYDLSDSVSLKNIVGYRYIDVDILQDQDGTSAPLLTTLNVATNHQYSEEFQISGTVGSQLDWMTGVFWMREYSRDYSYTNAFDAFGLGALNVVQAGVNADNNSRSVFGQVIWHATDDLNLTVGARANRDYREISNNSFRSVGTPPALRNPLGGLCTIQFADASFAPDSDCFRKESKVFTEPSYNITLDYHLDADQMVYIAHRHGYRTGGFSGFAAGVSLATSTTPYSDSFTPYEPETVDDLEIGYKGDMELAGTPLRVNTALFYSDYQDIQRLVSTLTSSGQLATKIQNAASGKLAGGELEVTWLPLDSLQIDLFFSYVHAEYDEWDDADNPNPAQRDKSGYSFPTPMRSGGLTARYTLPTPAEIGELSIQGNVYAQSRTQLADENGPGGLQSGYSLLGARIDWLRVMGSNLKLSLWGKNLNNTEYHSGGVNVNGTLGYYMAYAGAARSWGLDATYDF